MEKVFLHVDLDAFFASVEQLDHPEYKGKPIIVGGLPSDRRSVVSTASYEARKYGVHSAMPTYKALALCPNGIFVRGRMGRYHEKSEQVMSIFHEFSPDVIQMSIDEAFIDITGTERLLGNSYDVAMRLKKIVKEKTGLTVSVGLAPTMYLAKIASGLEKPDGLTVVKPGDEDKFMLSLPLEKVWGVGSKTLARLHEAGFSTTESIYKKTEKLLQTIFGSNTGSFLYNAVRGNKGMTFGDEAKNHSISSETTFDFDLTDRYAIDTALLELSQTVMFRLLREKGRSNSLALKIRYEDFTTVTVQSTSDLYFTSADDMFERAKKLFTKKYEEGRGIRLLGVFAQNVEDSSSPVQGNLFDSDNQKKSKVEQAILNLEDKHPGLKIKKARTIIKSILPLLFISFLFSLQNEKLFSEDTTETSSTGAGAIVFSDTVPLLPTIENEEAPTSLFSYKMKDSEIEFLASGYWQSEASISAASTFGYGNAFALSLGAPVFTQQVDLSLWFMLNKQWYFESSFADEFTKNKVAAGYKGNGILKSARIANRGIVFPSVYSASKTNRSIGGGDNSAPGASFHFEGKNWQSDAVVRYDMLTQKSKTYYGKNSVSTKQISCDSYVTGRQFILPSSDDVSDVLAVYVENSSGSYSDTNKRTYKKLSSSDYILISSQNMIVLSSDAGAAKTNSTLPAVAVVFSSSETLTNIKSELGSYGTYDSPGSENTFLGSVQTWFNERGGTINVSKYSYNKDSPFTYIDGNEALVLQYPSCFSPFANCSRYDGGTISEADVLVTHTSTDTEDKSFIASQIDDDTSLVSTNFFSSKNYWITVATESTSSSTSSSTYTLPSVRFPFAEASPEFYLGYSSDSDLAIAMQTYSEVTSYNIGNDAVDGTVSVYINEILDAGASYNKETGDVTPSGAISSNDKLYIVWSEDSGSTDGGALALAAGFLYYLTPDFSLDFSLTSRWSVSPNKTFADSSSSSSGFASFNTGAVYKKDSLTLSNSLSLSLDNTNTTGYYRILSMDSNSGDDIYLSSSSAVSLPADFAPVLNSRDFSSEINLSGNLDGSSSSITSVTDSSISGYKIPLSWNFSSFSEQDDYAWASVAIDLGSSGSSLSSSSTFSIALQSEDTTLKNYDVYLQLGVSADSDFTVEDSETISTWLISKSSSSDSNSTDVRYAFVPSIDASCEGEGNGTKQLGSGWQQVTVNLNDYDRSHLISNHDARIVLVSSLSNKSSDEIDFPQSGTLYAGPWSYTGSGFSASYNSDYLNVSVSEEYDSSLSSSLVSKFNSSTTNFVENVEWSSIQKDKEYASGDENSKLTLGRSFDDVSLSNYRYVNMYFKLNVTNYSPSSLEDSSLYFALERPDSNEEMETVLSTSFSSDEFIKYNDNAYHLLTIDLTARTVSVDNSVLSYASSSLIKNTSVVPVHISIKINTLYKDGSFCFDELFLSESNYAISALDKASVSYKKDGPIFSAGNICLLKDFAFSADGTASINKTLTEENAGSSSSSISGNSVLSFSSLGILFAIDAASSYSTISSTSATLTSSAQDATGITTAGYKVSTEKPLFNFITLSSSFRASPSSSSRSSANSASVSFSKIHLPLTISFNAESAGSLWSETQKSKASVEFSSTPYSFILEANVSEKNKTSTSISEDTVFESFNTSLSSAFSTGSYSAIKRSAEAYLKNTFNIPFISLKPVANISSVSVSTSSTCKDTTELEIVFPFKVAKNNFSFSWTKETSGTKLPISSSNTPAYFADYSELYTSLQERPWYFSSFIFADLFSSSLSSDISSSLNNSDSDLISYTGTYNFSWKRPLYNSYKDILFPSGCNISLARDIASSDSTADTYQFKTQASYNALNLFGKLGPYHLFKWYEQDSFISSLSATLKLPHDTPEDFSVLFTAYSEFDFYLKNNGLLKTGIEGEYETTSDWSGKCTFVWKRVSKFSPVVSLVSLFAPKLKTNEIKLTRTDSANYSISSGTNSSTTDAELIFKNSISLTHLLEAKVTKYLTVNSSINGTYTCTLNNIMSLSVTATLGGKVSF